MKALKDSIDFGKDNVRGLFNRLFYPTLLGMVFSMVLNVTDGIFVGRGIGSLALAAVNIVAPLFTLSGGIALMLGMGGSVVASIHLSKGNERTARIVATQSVSAAVAVLVLLSAVLLIWPEPILRLFGCSDTMMPYASDYLRTFAPFMFANGVILTTEFFIRLDGSPKYAMVGSIIGCVLNIFLDWLFIFPFGWGLHGAALATGISMLAGSVFLLAYLFDKRHNVRFNAFKVSTLRAWAHTLRNCGYMCKLGFSSMFAQFAVALMIIVGNNIFVRLDGDTGVAAFSVVCYLMPIVFMVYDAVAMAAQPVQSYNYGTGDFSRVKKAFRVAIATGVGYAVGVVLLTTVFAPSVVYVFIDPADPANPLAVEGLRLFSIGFVPMAVNIVVMSYFQSVERVLPATVISLLRGIVFMLACLLLMSHIWGNEGAWLAIPTSEILTMIVTLTMLACVKIGKKTAAA